MSVQTSGASFVRIAMPAEEGECMRVHVTTMDLITITMATAEASWTRWALEGDKSASSAREKAFSTTQA